MGKSKLFLLLALLLTFAVLVYAYPITFKVVPNLPGNFHTAIYKCTDSTCTSYGSLYASDFANPTQYTISGSGKQYFAEFDYKDCYLSNSYSLAVEDSTGNGPWNHSISFGKGVDCHASMMSFTSSAYTINSGNTVDLTATMAPMYNLTTSPYPPAALVPQFTLHFTTKLYVDGVQVDTKPVDIAYNTIGTVTYQYTFNTPGLHKVEIYTNASDCKCSSGLLRYKYLNITVNGYCGDNVITPPETCELPNTNNNANCPQTTSTCLGTKKGTRDSKGNCNSACGCTEDQFNYACVKDQCGATCAINSDCDDQNPNTVDSCTADCGCTHITQPYCGDNIITAPETCELPNTNNNANCAQTTSTCQGTKKGTRDSLGNCNSACGCTEDQFNYACVKDQCGATCAANSDCNDHDPNTVDTCTSECGCTHVCQPYCGDNIITAPETCELPSTSNNNYCSQTTTNCDGKKLGTRDALGNCLSNCSCTPDPFTYSCVKYQCGAECSTNTDCDDHNQNTVDTCTADCGCTHTNQPYCGDGTVQAPETCELPSTNNNAYCTQSTTSTCEGHKLGTRDSLGNCDSACGCTTDSFNYQCSKQCGAQCETNSDCSDGKACLADCTCQTCVPEDEVCDGVDNDCDGEIDEGLVDECSTLCGSGIKICYQGNWSDCTAPKPYPEICDGLDNNCDGEIDNDPVNPICTSDSQCGQSICGYEVLVSPKCNNPGTCNSYCSFLLTPKTEICGNGIDDDCDGLVDENCYNCTKDSQWGPGHQFQCLDDNTYLDCENNTYYHVDICKTYCSASPQCDGRAPGTELNSCNDYGQIYLQDYCDENCHLKDDNCESGYLGCTADAECDELAPLTGNCSATCTTTHGKCNDGKLDAGEQCDPLGLNSVYCSQSNVSDCLGAKIGTRDNLGDCITGCLCTSDNFNYQCSKQCGAQCTTNTDCPQGSTCLSDCSCSVIPPKCGDGNLDVGEQCELPSTFNNTYCTQDITSCQGTKLGTRDSLGDCNQVCACDTDQFTYNCVKDQCGAECGLNADCADTYCDNLDGCKGNDYYNYSNVANTCQGSCACTDNSCAAPTITYNSSLCTRCQTDDNCNALDRDYCFGSKVMHDEGKCIDFVCTVQASQKTNCNDGIYCNGQETCSNATCVAATAVNCTDSLFCSVQEHCDETLDRCAYDIRDCSANDLISIEECTHTPDSNPFTLDTAAGFISICDESKDKCTTGNYTFTHVCDESCGAECLPGQIDMLTCGVSDVGVCEYGHKMRSCESDCGYTDWTDCMGAVYPSNETCDGLDNDCDGTIDEDPLYTACKTNLDCGVPSCGLGITLTPTCLNPGSCSARCVYTIGFTTEICGNGVDDNCNGQIDENCEICLTDSIWGTRHQFLCNENNTYMECVNNTYVYRDTCKQYCSASPQCDGRKIGTYLNTCTDFGETFLQDYCDENCHLADDNCENDFLGCTSDEFCDELAPGTGDCSDTCNQIKRCGDGIILPPEKCELPDTTNNINCTQSTQTCLGTKLGTRDALGNCNSECGCTEDTFTYNCVKDSCGAQCTTNDDCAPKCNGDVYSFSGSCGAECACSYSTENCNLKDGWYNTTTTQWLNTSQCTEKQQVWQEYRDYTCSLATRCSYTITNNRWTDTGNTQNKPDQTTCDDGLFCTTPDTCTSGVCGGIARVCTDAFGCTQDSCNEQTDSCEHVANNTVCDNGLFCDGAEICNIYHGCLPGTQVDCSSHNISEVAECTHNPDNKTFTWDFGAGFISTCDDAVDQCTTSTQTLTHTCNKAVCNADCESNQDCAPKCIVDVYYFGGICNTASTCACSYSTENCNLKDGWYNTTTIQWLNTSQCTEKQQVWQEYRDYTCSLATRCSYTITNNRWTDTGITQNKPDQTVCNDGLFCTTPDTCTSGVCGGVAKVCSDPFSCTQDSCNEATDSCEHVANNTLCNNGLFCDGVETCDLQSGCISGTPIDCSANDLSAIGRCDNNPDNIIYTWDSAPGFTSVCDEPTDTCTTGSYTFTHVCDKTNCNAQCLLDETSTQHCGLTDVGECEYGHQTRSCEYNCLWSQWGTCQGAVYPTEELCDGKDNDCNGIVDDHCFDCIIGGAPYYHDSDQGWKFVPRLYLDTSTRQVHASNLDGGALLTRPAMYAFEGEQLSWEVLVWDKNGVEKMGDIFVSVMPKNGTFDACIEANCMMIPRNNMTPGGIQEGEEHITQFNPTTMRWFKCTFTVESQESMHGPYLIQPQAVDLDGLRGGVSSFETWFLNPKLSLSVSGTPQFGELRPGTAGYSQTVTIRNDAEGGVLYTTDISGTDFYDSTHSGGMCPTSNVMRLSNFAYYAVSGAYSTMSNIGADAEGYDLIPYERSSPVFRQPIIDVMPYLTSGSEISMTFRLKLPEPCNGNFNTGHIYFWAEPI